MALVSWRWLQLMALAVRSFGLCTYHDGEGVKYPKYPHVEIHLLEFIHRCRANSISATFIISIRASTTGKLISDGECRGATESHVGSTSPTAQVCRGSCLLGQWEQCEYEGARREGAGRGGTVGMLVGAAGS